MPLAKFQVPLLRLQILAGAIAILCGSGDGAASEALAQCRGMSATPQGSAAVTSSQDGLLHGVRGGRLLLGIEPPDTYFSPEFGVILESPDGAVCQLRLAAPDLRAVAVSGRGSWRAVEVGICDAAHGACTPVRVEFQTVLHTLARR